MKTLIFSLVLVVCMLISWYSERSTNKSIDKFCKENKEDDNE